MSRKARLFAVIWGVALLVIAVLYRLTMPGALFLVRFTDKSKEATAAGESLDVSKATIDGAGRSIKAKVYKPKKGFGSVLLVIHGVHSGGLDEPRLVRFSKLLAGMGNAVVTPEIEDLKTYEITQRAVEDIKAAAVWTLDDSGLTEQAKNKKLGIMGISFAGGLSLSAASSPELKGRVGFVFSFGGHASLARTMRYLTTGALPDGRDLPPHIYGQAVLARRFAEQLVPAEQVETLRKILLDYLKEDFSKVRSELDAMEPESKKMVQLCLDRDTEELGAILEPLTADLSLPAVLSPDRGEPPTCPVFLLHGVDDNVIPASETLALERWAETKTKTTALVSDLIRHVDLDSEAEESPPMMSYWKLVRFWTELLRS